MAIELAQDTERVAHFLSAPEAISTGRDIVLDNLVAALTATAAHPDQAVQTLAAGTLREVHRIQKAARQRVAAQHRELANKRLGLIIDFVEVHFRLEPGVLRGPRKPQRISTARQIAYWLCRTVTGASFPTIAESFGGRDHSTVLFGCNLIQRRIDREGGFRLAIESIERQLTASTTTAAAA